MAFSCQRIRQIVAESQKLPFQNEGLGARAMQQRSRLRACGDGWLLHRRNLDCLTVEHACLLHALYYFRESIWESYSAAGREGSSLHMVEP